MLTFGRETTFVESYILLFYLFTYWRSLQDSKHTTQQISNPTDLLLGMLMLMKLVFESKGEESLDRIFPTMQCHNLSRDPPPLLCLHDDVSFPFHLFLLSNHGCLWKSPPLSPSLHQRTHGPPFYMHRKIPLPKEAETVCTVWPLKNHPTQLSFAGKCLWQCSFSLAILETTKGFDSMIVLGDHAKSPLGSFPLCSIEESNPHFLHFLKGDVGSRGRV